ncbi:unnamed protein product [Polarella glacialis]|uniref:VDE lipocalin domain-containing protein n=1 Tax=Polarella glacialis TaxID=89957 RepID=A0A813F2W7_POLGL|nr:unnamed protein product [Polarella glacialis]
MAWTTQRLPISEVRGSWKDSDAELRQLSRPRLPNFSWHSFRGRLSRPPLLWSLVGAVVLVAGCEDLAFSGQGLVSRPNVGRTSRQAEPWSATLPEDVQTVPPQDLPAGDGWSWLSSLQLALLTLSLVFGLCLGAAPAFAAKVDTEVAGFAEFAEKGGAMDVNPSCFVTSCGQQTKDCFTNSRCLKGTLCLSRCRGGQDCATQCFAEFGGKKLDAWLKCTVETEKCVSVPQQAGTVVNKFFETNIPKKLPNFNPSSLDGSWFKVRGFNPKYDCYKCQPNSFKYDPESKTTTADIKLRVPNLKSTGFMQNDIEERLRVLDESNRATFQAHGEIFGLSFDEEWYILAGDDDFKLVAYKGQNLQDIYEGAFIYSRTAEISPAVEVKARQAAEANGYAWAKFCVVDNSCPPQPATQANQEEAKLEWDDIPDLIEWFAPGTIPKKQFSGAY